MCISIGVLSLDKFSRISKIRALMPPDTNILALTATANLTTQNKITEFGNGGMQGGGKDPK